MSARFWFTLITLVVALGAAGLVVSISPGPTAQVKQNQVEHGLKVEGPWRCDFRNGTIQIITLPTGERVLIASDVYAMGVTLLPPLEEPATTH